MRLSSIVVNLAIAALLFGAVSRAEAASPDSSQRLPSPGAAGEGMSLDRWREEDQAAREALNANARRRPGS